MARIRSVKPEFWSDGKVARVSRDARLLFLGLLNESDDEGRQIGSPKRIGGTVFPHDEDVTAANVRTWLAELEREGLVSFYRVAGVDYLLLVGFTKHQRISHPTESRLPSPQEAESFQNPAPEPLQNLSGDVPESLRPDLGIDLGIDLGTRKTTIRLAPEPSPVAQVFDAWVTSTGKSGRTVLDSKRKRTIVAALKDYPLEDVIDAVRGWKQSPFHAGQNDARKVYNELSLLLRDCHQIEQFRDLERGTAPVGRASDPATDLVSRMREMEGR